MGPLFEWIYWVNRKHFTSKVVRRLCRYSCPNKMVWFAWKTNMKALTLNFGNGDTSMMAQYLMGMTLVLRSSISSVWSPSCQVSLSRESLYSIWAQIMTQPFLSRRSEVFTVFPINFVKLFLRGTCFQKSLNSTTFFNGLYCCIISMHWMFYVLFRFS